MKIDENRQIYMCCELVDRLFSANLGPAGRHEVSLLAVWEQCSCKPTLFAVLGGQFGQLALQHRLLLLLARVAPFVAVQRLHLHGSTVLVFG